jgi:hypothetical protein
VEVRFGKRSARPYFVHHARRVIRKEFRPLTNLVHKKGMLLQHYHNNIEFCARKNMELMWSKKGKVMALYAIRFYA